jgi:hypothetical protein
LTVRGSVSKVICFERFFDPRVFAVVQNAFKMLDDEERMAHVKEVLDEAKFKLKTMVRRSAGR